MAEELILKHVLKNAVDHDGKAQLGAVINKVVGEKPELKKDMKKLASKIKTVIKAVDKMKFSEQKKKLLKLWPDALKRKEEKEKVLPELLEAKSGKVVLRVAPNVNAPLHIGHAKMFILNDEYKKRYKGKLILRFDDTDPDVKRPILKVYNWDIEDIKWLGVFPDQIVYASDRIPLYYEVADKLIKIGKAYVCTCSQEMQQKNRAREICCKHRGQSPKENKKLWGQMKAGEFKKGEAVLKIKTNMNHPNPAIRDWIAFRMVSMSHPRVGDKYKTWPMLDFQSAVDDYTLGVTHILRGKELRDSTERQKYIYRYMDWNYPETWYWGRVSIQELGKISKSDIAKKMQNKRYKRENDPVTLAYFRKKGTKPRAIREFFLQMGLTEKDQKVSLKILEAINKEYS
jgi:glutamyl-tRNA synthetase